MSYQFTPPKELPTTLQEWFDRAGEHLLRQGKKAMRIDSDGIEYCMYRHETDEGLTACAIGACIPAELYDKTLEGKSADELDLLEDCKFSYNLEELQCIHDDHEPDSWYSQLLIFATDHNLSKDRIIAVQKELAQK